MYSCPGALLAAVAGPLRRYLRQRPDTARCVVALVTKGDGDGNPSLLEELQQVRACVCICAAAGGCLAAESLCAVWQQVRVKIRG